MVWVWVIVAAAVGGAVMLAWFAVWLWRKTLVLLGALGALGDQAGALFDILDGFGSPPSHGDEDALTAT
ncbi:MAG: hypothetical protein L0G22_03120 [Propionibacteriaceae bacterium]|nr:hypothetical protein [Propionibacteriaceae bacterium]